ncbi:RNase H domain-containing protein [Trichonephila clavipes]|nr:RNase H domain-containing protein [Trichonephila clavipes]
MKRVILHHIFKIWQESWSQPMRRTDVKLTRLRIGHTRFTHRHLLLGEDAPECPSCKVQNVKLGGYQTCLTINRLWHELCDMLRRLVRTTAPGHHDCSIQE